MSKETTKRTVKQLVTNIKNCHQIICTAAVKGKITDGRGMARLSQSLHKDVDELASRIKEKE